MVLTSSYLETPNGILYDKKGLQPTHSIDQAAGQGNSSWATDKFIAATKRLMQGKISRASSIIIRPVHTKRRFHDIGN